MKNSERYIELSNGKMIKQKYFVTAYTKDLIDFGYTALKEQIVNDCVNDLMDGRYDDGNVIMGFVKSKLNNEQFKSKN